MATINVNLGQNPDSSSRALFSFSRNFLHLPPGLAEQADGFLYAMLIQLGVGVAVHQLTRVTTVLSILMLSILAALVLVYRSLHANTAAQRILLRSSAMLLLVEITFVFLYLSRLKGGLP